MSFSFIREGDHTDHGGTVLSSGAITVIDGRPIAFVGTMVTCPKCRGIFPIVTSKNPGMNFDGRHAAFEGDRTACGATLIASQGNAFANVPVGAGRSSTSARHETDDTTERYRGRFQVVGADGRPAANTPYSLRTPEGRTISGTTDVDGYTQWHHADSPASLIFSREEPE
ncbi:PAAR domain-containing protein [Burkholderia guangdongensis]|uniref:PAAR domain-containing protein n=1 Tax=Burkholderia guangdongensis TaxID=1792500 RepID=UPI0015CBB28B|nr:PAAR domain-containing protein [Burkholderia guangdongensis]